jgi:hypothetical protein
MGSTIVVYSELQRQHHAVTLIFLLEKKPVTEVEQSCERHADAY